MLNTILTLAAAGAGWALGSLVTRRALERRIDERFQALERRLQSPETARPSAAEPKPAAIAPVPVEEEVPVEVLAVISAAICAFLGKPARIRRVRRIPSGMNPWAQVGRVSVMASHALNRK